MGQEKTAGVTSIRRGDLMNRSTVYVILAVLLGCCCALCQGQSPEAAKATWLVLVETANIEVIPTPSPEPDSDICENCNGRGKVGDGTIMRICPVCDGTGKKKKQESLPIADGWPPKDMILYDHAAIDIYSRDDCPHCESLKAIVPEMIDSGWQVRIHEQSEGFVPSSTIWVNGHQLQVEGYPGRSMFFESLREATRRFPRRER